MTATAPYAHLLDGRTLLPVILGGDIGGYSLARAFHEAFGVRSIIVSSTLGGVVRDSTIVINDVRPDMDDPDVTVAALQEIAQRNPGALLIAIASADWLVHTLIQRRAELEPAYAIPYVDEPLFDQVTSKEEFATLCAEYGLAHPLTTVVDLTVGPEVDTAGMSFPVIAKAGSTAAFHAVEYSGKEKVATVASAADLHDLLGRVHASGYRDSFIIQDLIPGDDAGLRIVNTYVDKSGAVTYSVFGHILLQEHTPSTVGNSSVVMTVHDADALAQIERLLTGIGWRGVASLDMKVDPRTGEMVYFELNPRLSRSNYYVTGSGVNPAVAYVREWLLGLPAADAPVPLKPSDHLFTVVPTALLKRYLIDPALRKQVKPLLRGKTSNPLWNKADRKPRRVAYVLAHQLNQVKKYRTFYPRATQRSEYEAGREAAQQAAKN
jgi:D-aspartate ligase